MNLRAILLEAFFVALGVLLGISISEWRQGQLQREDALAGLDAIREELARNRDLVVAARDYHQSKMSLLQEVAAQGEGAALPQPRQFERGFIAPAQPLNTAWEAAKLTDAISHLPREVVFTASEIYQRQDAYRQQSAATSEIIYSILLDEGPEGVMRRFRNLMTVQGTFWYRENQLIEAYDAALTQLGPSP